MNKSIINRVCLLTVQICGIAFLRSFVIFAQPIEVQHIANFTDKSYATEHYETDSLTIDECVMTALKNNPDLKAAIDELHAVYARYTGVRSTLFPSIRIESGYERFSNGQRIIPPHGVSESGVFSDQLTRADAVITIPVFNGGRTLNGIRASSHTHKAQEYRTLRQKDLLTFAVSNLFYTISSLEKRLVSVQQSIEAMESHQKHVQAMIEAKKSAQVDLLRTNVRLANLRQQMLVGRNQVASYRLQLSAVMAVDISMRPLITQIPSDIFNAVSSPDTLYEQALGLRADLLASIESLEAQAHRVDLAVSMFAPSISMKGGYGIRSDVSGEYELAATAGLTMSLPLFEGGRNTAKVKEERALLAAQKNRVHALRLQIATEIETAVLDINAARERIGIARMAIVAAKEGLRIENIKYEQGKGTISDVLDAQTELLEVETIHDEASSGLLIACARLQLASGGVSK